MHILDGWLSLPVVVVTWFITLPVFIISVHHIRKDFNELKFVQMGVMGAVIFVAQMFNFPVGPGISGHLVGAALATIVLGPQAAMLVLAAVLSIQALLFSDGGILVLGANIFNMSITGALFTHQLQKMLERLIKEKRLLPTVTGLVGGITAVVFSSLFAGLELWLSGNIDASGMALIIAWHVVIGAAEGIITLGIIRYLQIIEFPLPMEEKATTVEG